MEQCADTMSIGQLSSHGLRGHSSMSRSRSARLKTRYDIPVQHARHHSVISFPRRIANRLDIDTTASRLYRARKARRCSQEGAYDHAPGHVRLFHHDPSSIGVT